MLEILTDSVLDCLKLLPFLFLSFLVIEYIEHRMNEKSRQLIFRAGRFGPVLGGLLGMVPQCGFAAMGAGLFAGEVISPGTLLAVFLSSSDEMLPILLSEGMPFHDAFGIVLTKAVTGMICGLALDVVAGKIGWRKKRLGNHAQICESDNCHCEEEGSLLKSAVIHTGEIMMFLFVITLLLGFTMENLHLESMRTFWDRFPLLEKMVIALCGMIPNCGSSVLVTKLYMQGLVTRGALFSGLLCGSGAGLLVLVRENRNQKENLLFLTILFISGVTAGCILA